MWTADSKTPSLQNADSIGRRAAITVMFPSHTPKRSLVEESTFGFQNVMVMEE